MGYIARRYRDHPLATRRPLIHVVDPRHWQPDADAVFHMAPPKMRSPILHPTSVAEYRRTHPISHRELGEMEEEAAIFSPSITGAVGAGVGLLLVPMLLLLCLGNMIIKWRRKNHKLDKAHQRHASL